jgi:hypothetical protein
MEAADDKALKADELIDGGRYEEAADLIDEIRADLLELEEDIEAECEPAYEHIYNEVDNKSYYGKIVRVAEEHGEDPSVIGALKSASTELRQ